MCNRPYSCKAALQRHLMSHNGNAEKRIFECSVCKQRLSSEQNLKRHTMMHNPNRPTFKCDKCEKLFVDKSYLAMHHRLIHGSIKPKLECPTCHKFISSKGNLKRHLQTHGENQPKIECETCKARYSCMSSLRKHIKLVHSEDKVLYPYACSKCPRKFSHKGNRDKHLITHMHSDQRPRYPCTECNKTLACKVTLKRHMMRHHCANRQMYNCMVCDKSYYDRQGYMEHVKRHNINQPTFSCPKCPKSYRSRLILRRHINAKHGCGNTQVECDVCHKIVLRRNLRDHKDYAHSNRDRWKTCSKCGKSVHNISQHMRIHSGDRLKCSQCNSCFSNKGNLAKHILYTHAQQGILKKCHVCSLEFKPFYLEQHIRRMHRMNTYVKCAICKLDLVKCNLRNHMKIHIVKEKRKKEMCPVCQGEFLHLKKHLRLQHGNLPLLNCQKCSKTFKSGFGLWHHMKKHNGDNYGACPVCKKNVTRLRLKDHISRMHPAEERKRQTCPICRKEVLELNRHLKQSHRNEMFYCDKCSKTFQYEFELKQHGSQVHGDEKKSVCLACSKEVYDLKSHLKIHIGKQFNPIVE